MKYLPLSSVLMLLTYKIALASPYIGIYEFLPDESLHCNKILDREVLIRESGIETISAWYRGSFIYDGKPHDEYGQVIHQPFFVAEQINRGNAIWYGGSCYSDGLRWRYENIETKSYIQVIQSKVNTGTFCNGKRELEPRSSQKIELLGDKLIYSYGMAKKKRSNIFETLKKCVFKRIDDL